jgi:hypothetical protein
MASAEELRDQLLTIERELAEGDGDAYRRHLAADAVVIVPGAVLTRDQCAAVMDDSSGWDGYEIIEPQVIELGDDGAILSYHWRSRRGDSSYDALMSTVYARRGRDWQVALHQQTPQPPE